MFYRHIWRVLAEAFAAEAEALARVHELLAEIMVDELGHIGERRTFLGNPGLSFARQILPVMMRKFFADIPEAEVILDVPQMVREALAFDYSDIDAAITGRAWIPAYCGA
jgi:DNA-binding transcriptional LysR family regulator